MNLFEKAGWMVIITVLLIAEINAIRGANTQAENDRKEQIVRAGAKIDHVTPR